MDRAFEKQFFSAYDLLELTPENFDAEVFKENSKLHGVFFWGHDCPNCDVAKKSLLNHQGDVLPLGLRWFSVNVYEHPELGTRFGLHGVPTFLFFLNGKRLGRISPFPGMAPFKEALEGLLVKHSLK